MNQSIIRVSGLRKAFKGTEVLKGIDFEVEAGSVFCLLGSNGAGKTTTVRILSTLLRANGGTATICGYDVEREAARVRGCISLTGQYAAVDGLLTGRENLALMGKLLHVPNATRRAQELLARFELTDAADRRSATYSGGMRRKLDIAMSLLAAPRVLFLDEPTTGLDPQNRIAMWEEIEKLKADGVTVFLTTQYLEEAERLADRVVILDKGVIAAQGTVEELKSLLPGGAVAFTFADADVEAAALLLSDCPVKANGDVHTMTVMTDGSVSMLTDLLALLRDAGITPLSMAQKQPTLEDVFLVQVGAVKGE